MNNSDFSWSAADIEASKEFSNEKLSVKLDNIINNLSDLARKEIQNLFEQSIEKVRKVEKFVDLNKFRLEKQIEEEMLWYLFYGDSIVLAYCEPKLECKDGKLSMVIKHKFISYE